MEQNRFFRAVWRFNALLLALGGIFFVGMLGWGFLNQPRFRAPPEGHFTPVPKGAETENTYRLSRLEVGVDREDFFRLGRWDGAPSEYGLQSVQLGSSNEYHGPDTVNLMAVDETSGANHWLFHGFSREIVSEDPITKPGGGSGFPPRPVGSSPFAAGNSTVALVIHTIDADTNKDGALTDKDMQSLYIYRPGLGFATKLLDADYFLSNDQSEDGRYLVVYERGKTAHAAVYSLPDFKLVSEKAISAVPN